MKTYKDLDNNLWAYEEDGSQDHLIPSDYIQITDEEAKAIHISQQPVINLQDAINAEARAYLASTDWFVIRMSENGTPIPIDVLTKRAEARLAVI
jgi:hypothetical protein